MGSKDGEGNDNERPRHKVTISQAFAVGKYPVTFGEWDAAVAAGGVSRKPVDEGWGRGRGQPPSSKSRGTMRKLTSNGCRLRRASLTGS